MREETLPSGTVITINPAPFLDAKDLFQALATQFQLTPITKDMQVMELQKNLFTACVSSPLVEKLVWKCLLRCTIENEKVTPETFEDVERRQDYIPACMEVVKENVSPFLTSLSPELKGILPTQMPSSSADSAKGGTPRA
jgi:hypothetical protein